MLLGFFLNAAIDQNCEKYIRAQGLEGEVESKIKALYKDKGMTRPVYNGNCQRATTVSDLCFRGYGVRCLPRKSMRGSGQIP